MEGACGMILPTEDPNVVIKKVYRKENKHHRTRSHRAPQQYSLQIWANSFFNHNNMIFVPKAWGLEDHQYKMERIDVSDPVPYELMRADKDLRKELTAFYMEGRRAGIYPMDFELYRQANGRIAMLDFDKFGMWNNDGSVEFPWGLHWTADEVKRLTPIPLNIDFFIR